MHPSLWRATGVRGVLAIVGREGRSAVFGLPPKAPALKDPGAELARRFLRAYGPARPKLFADWAGLATSHAAALWERAGRLVGVDLEGTQGLGARRGPSRARREARIDGVRLLANLDPLNAGRDRELLVPDAAVRKRIWTVLGGPGTVLVARRCRRSVAPAQEGQEAARHRRAARRAHAGGEDELAAEAERIAPFRGAETAELTHRVDLTPERMAGRLRPHPIHPRCVRVLKLITGRRWCRWRWWPRSGTGRWCWDSSPLAGRLTGTVEEWLPALSTLGDLTEARRRPVLEGERRRLPVGIDRPLAAAHWSG